MRWRRCDATGVTQTTAAPQIVQRPLSLAAASKKAAGAVLDALASRETGLSEIEARRRLETVGRTRCAAMVLVLSPSSHGSCVTRSFCCCSALHSPLHSWASGPTR